VETLKAISKIEQAYGHALTNLLGSAYTKLPESEDTTSVGNAWTRFVVMTCSSIAM